MVVVAEETHGIPGEPVRISSENLVPETIDDLMKALDSQEMQSENLAPISLSPALYEITIDFDYMLLFDEMFPIKRDFLDRIKRVFCLME